jgi:hypothetical protein
MTEMVGTRSLAASVQGTAVFGNGYIWPLVTGKAPITDQVLQMSEER